MADVFTADQSRQGPFERAGVWRRLGAILIDSIPIVVALQLLALLLFPLTHGRVQFADGFYAISCNKLDAVPAGAVVPADFNANMIVDCRHDVFGLTSARMLRVARMTRSGSFTTEVHIDSMLDAEGVPVAGLSLGFLLLPLLLLWRFASDGRRGTPGRRICRIQLADAVDGTAPSAAAVRKRYGLLLAILSPILIWFVAASASLVAAIPSYLLLWTMLAVYSPALIVALFAWKQVYWREDTWYDRYAGTAVLRVDRAETVPLAPTAPAFAWSEPASSGDAAAETLQHALPPPLPPMVPQARSYVVRHWRGELSLPVSYWVNGTLLGLIAGIVIAVLAAVIIHEQLDARPVAGLVVLCSIWLGIIVLTLWQTIGIWRAATRYRAGGKRGWGVVAKVMVVVGVGTTLLQLVNTGLPQIAGIAEIVGGDNSFGPHQFKVLASGEMLEFSGGIKFGVAQELESLLSAMPDVKTVRLNSIGGRIREAQKMSDIIKARGLSTLVEKDCLSACTIVFLGGTDRAIMSNARLGFHQPSYRGITAADRGRMIAGEEDRLQRFGLSRSFAERANKAEPASMWFPDIGELTREHVVTRVVAAQAARPAAPAADTSSRKVVTNAVSAADMEPVPDLPALSGPPRRSFPSRPTS